MQAKGKVGDVGGACGTDQCAGATAGKKESGSEKLWHWNGNLDISLLFRVKDLN